MKRNLKILGLAMAVAAALSAIAVSVSSANFTTGSDATTLTLTTLDYQVFETLGTSGENAEVRCESITAGNETFGTESTELTVHPTYSGNCALFIEGLGFLSPEIITKGCNYIFTTTETENIHIECETGKQIEVTAFILGKFRKCLDIHEQTPTTAHVDYHNGTDAATGKMDFEIESTVEGITYEKTGSCAFGVIEANDARYTGQVTVTGHNSPVGLTAVISSGFTTGSDSTTLTAKALNNQVFKTTGTAGENSEISCESIAVSGEPVGTEESELTFHPTYSGSCTVNVEGIGALTAEVITTGCNYILTTTETENIHIECETGKQIEVTAFLLGKFRKCLDFHAQTPTTALVDYHNGTNGVTGAMDVEVESTISGITYEKTGSCAFGTTEGNDAKYEGKITLTDSSQKESVDVTKS
jgi:hypothetical protein